MNLSFPVLSLEEIFTLAYRTLLLSDQPQFSSFLNHNPVLDELKQIFARFEQSYQRNGTGKGKQIFELDRLRKRYLTGFKAQIKGLANMNGLVEKQQKADELLKIINQYLPANRAKNKYADLTAPLNKCLDELSTTSNQNKLRFIGVLDSFNLLKETQQQFEQLIIEKAEQDSLWHQQQSATKLRKELVNSLKDYYELVKIMRKQQGWDKLYLNLQELSKGIMFAHHNQANDKEQLIDSNSK